MTLRRSARIAAALSRRSPPPSPAKEPSATGGTSDIPQTPADNTAVDRAFSSESVFSMKRKAATIPSHDDSVNTPSSQYGGPYEDSTSTSQRPSDAGNEKIDASFSPSLIRAQRSKRTCIKRVGQPCKPDMSNVALVSKHELNVEKAETKKRNFATASPGEELNEMNKQKRMKASENSAFNVENPSIDKNDSHEKFQDRTVHYEAPSTEANQSTTNRVVPETVEDKKEQSEATNGQNVFRATNGASDGVIPEADGITGAQSRPNLRRTCRIRVGGVRPKGPLASKSPAERFPQPRLDEVPDSIPLAWAPPSPPRTHAPPSRERTRIISNRRSGPLTPIFVGDVELRLGTEEETYATMLALADLLFPNLRESCPNEDDMVCAFGELAGLNDPSRRFHFLPHSTIQVEDSEKKCVVCLENTLQGDTMQHLPCLHNFHKDCIDPWLSLNPTCPVCRQRIF